MNRRGRRFVELRDFRAHEESLNVKRLKDDELEFDEKHCRSRRSSGSSTNSPT